MQRWYVIHSHPHAEQRAAQHLRNQGFTVYLPCYRKRRRHARRTELMRAPLFPRYLFVRMDVEECQWRSISGTIGVHYLLRDGDFPLSVPDAVIDSIHKRENGDGLVVVEPQNIRIGQSLRIIEGPFADHSGLFETMIDNRVALLLSLLGRQIRIKVSLESVAT
jgi:transcriptional antiterminator RfaH